MVKTSQVPYEKIVGGLLLCGTVGLLYGQTLNVPFYLDDQWAIVEKYLLRDLPATVRQIFSPRGLTNLTFAVNYRLTGWALPPLHLVNVALHAGCGLLVWLLLRRLLGKGRWLPLLGALLFVAHPLQTQAVTYLVQRSAVLATGFAVAAVLCHRRARGGLEEGGKRLSRGYLAWHGGVLLCGACAVLAKENAATLPLLLIVHDLLFPLPQRRSWRQRLADYLPFFVAPLLLGAPLLMNLLRGGSIPRTASALLTLQHNDPLHYLVTQFSVFWIYLRLLILPYGQALEHNYPVVAEILTLQNGLALGGLLVLAWLAWRLRRRRPLLVFGVAWFFLGLAVESSVIPLDPLFEHRLYLPMVGFVLVLVDGIPALLGERRALGVLLVALLICLPLTWQRNALWNDPLRFNEHDLTVAPESERAHLALIYNYRDAGRLAEEEQCALELLRINPRFGLAYEELALLYAKRGESERGLSLLMGALGRQPGDQGLYKAGAKIYLGMGQPDAALQFLRRGAAANPRSSGMLDQLAALQFELGDAVAAEETYRRSLLLNSNTASVHRYLARALYSQGRMAEALEEVRLALRLEPGNPDALEGLGMSAVALGDLATAEQAADQLRYREPDAWMKLRDAIALKRQGLP